ncbi:vWA domain-containing protein [Domibacillus indicus]|uniref:vWA domain-containing protein n=1 Tax=Domibacillus indicus TaxID=1437523 RepID=UPI0006181C78|nr:VWA domain-containing protein [Domibacillus indicus]
MKKFVVNAVLSIIVLFLIMPFNALQTKAQGNTIGVSVTAAPSQSVVVKPIDSNARARIDMKMIPFGKYEQLARKPVDVVFIFDTSGSMNESGTRPQKFQSAKEAMYKALDYFQKNAGPNDRFAFIPFNSGIDMNNIIDINYGTGSKEAVNWKLEQIKYKVNRLAANGGTNYRSPMEYAENMLTGSTNEKNIIFMTDGELTVSEERTAVCDYYCYDDGINTVSQYTNGSFGYYSQRFRNVTNPYIFNGVNWINTSSSEGKKQAINLFRKNAKNKAQALGAKNIKMYSIGFGNDPSELDQPYLEELSSVTGAYASPASEGNIDRIFLDIAESINKQKLDVEVTLDLAKFGGKVIAAEGANAAIDGTKVTLRKTFEYDYQQNAPAPVDLTLPLEFTAVGTYTFDNIKLTYKRPDGSTGSANVQPVTIEVRAEAPPAINGSMVLKGELESNPVNNLVKQAGKRTNYFRADYNLTPNGLSNSTVKGTLKNIKLIQPLPDGVSLDEKSASNVKLQTNGSTGAKEAVITLTQTVTYANGAFTPASFGASLKLKADWALHNVTMPQARVEYEDTRFNQTYSSSIPSASDRITSKVRLDDENSHNYDGYANGSIKKVEKSSGSTVAETAYPNDYSLLPEPVKDMVFTDGNKKAINITYSDDSSAVLYFTADIGMTGADSKAAVEDKAVVYESVDARLSRFVAGEGVRYEYRISTQKAEGEAWETGGWAALAKNQTVPLTAMGVNKIEVRSFGGFSLGSDEIISKQVTIKKKIDRVEIWSVGDKREPITELQVTEGESKEFEVKIFLEGNDEPESAADYPWIYKLTDETVALAVPGEKNIGTAAGIKPGETTLTVTPDMDPKANPENKSANLDIIVTSAFTELEGVTFEQSKYTNKTKEKVIDMLETTPSGLEDTIKVTNVYASNPEGDIVKITQPGGGDGDWYIEAGTETGYTRVTAVVEQQKPDGSVIEKEAKARFETGNGDNTTAEEIEGEW